MLSVAVGAVRRTVKAAAYVACGCALAYAAMKVALAADGAAGLPGFPATAEVNAAYSQIALRQLGNGTLALVAAVVALATVRRWGGAVPRPLLIVVTWLGWLALVAGAGVLVARYCSLTSSFAPIERNVTSTLVVAIAVVWVVSWGTMAWGYLRA
jgi:hypothetical protein